MDDATKKHIQDAIDASDLNAVRAIVNGPVKYEDGNAPDQLRGVSVRVDAQSSTLHSNDIVKSL